MIIATIVIATLAALVFMLLRGGDEAHPVRHRHDAARDRALWVARERLTAGQIDAEQYERICRAFSR